MQKKKCVGDKIIAKSPKNRRRGETKKEKNEIKSSCEGELHAERKAELLKEKGDRSRGAAAWRREIDYILA